MKGLLAFAIAGVLAALMSAAVGYATDVYCEPVASAVLGGFLFAPAVAAVACAAGWYVGRPSRSSFLRIAIPVVALSLIAGAIGWEAPESKFLLDPEIDTVLARGFSKDRFAAVQPGMTQAEVTALLGKPVWVIPSSERVIWLFSNDGDGRTRDRAWRRYQIELSPSGVVTWRGTGWSCD